MKVKPGKNLKAIKTTDGNQGDRNHRVKLNDRNHQVKLNDRNPRAKLNDRNPRAKLNDRNHRVKLNVRNHRVKLNVRNHRVKLNVRNPRGFYNFKFPIDHNFQMVQDLTGWMRPQAPGKNRPPAKDRHRLMQDPEKQGIGDGGRLCDRCHQKISLSDLYGRYQNGFFVVSGYRCPSCGFETCKTGVVSGNSRYDGRKIL